MSRFLIHSATVVALIAGSTAGAAPGDVDEFVRCARILMADGKVRPAEVLANEAIRLDTTRGEGYLVRGIIKIERKDPEGAIVDINQALRLGLTGKDGPYQAYCHRGRAHARLKQFEAAERDFASALKFAEAAGHKAEVHFHRGLARDLEGKTQDALTDLSAAIELVSTEPAYFLTRGILYKKLGMKDRAEQDFARAEKLK